MSYLDEKATDVALASMLVAVAKRVSERNGVADSDAREALQRAENIEEHARKRLQWAVNEVSGLTLSLVKKESE